MRERLAGEPLTIAAEAMYHLWELEHRRNPMDLDGMMCRLKDLSAYSLTHAEILAQREGVELLALGMFFGMTSDPELRKHNQGRLTQLHPETVDYQGRPEKIEKKIAGRKQLRACQSKREDPSYRQRRLL